VPTATRRRASTTARKPPRPTRAAARSSSKGTFDVIPGTNIDEFVGPWIVSFVAIPLVGMLAHQVWGGGAWRWLILAFAFIIAGCFAVATWHEAEPRGRRVQVRASVSVAFAFASIGITCVIGLVSLDGFVRPWADVHAIANFALSVSWNIRRSRAIRGDGDDAHPVTDRLAEALGLHPSTTARVVEDSPTRIVARMTHRWNSVRDLQRVGEALARLKGLPATGVRVVPDPDDSGRSTLTLMKEDVLRQSLPWPGLSRPGGSVTDPARIGVYEDGGDLEIVRPGQPAGQDEGVEPRPSISTATAGMAGAGKTAGALCELAELISRDDVVIWWSDTSKPDQVLPAFRPAVDWVVRDRAGTRAMVAALDPIITHRAKALASIGLTEWTRRAWTELGMPYLYVGFQEAARVLEDLGTDIVRVGEATRSVGISLDFSLQRHSATNMPTDLRAVTGSGWAFGLKSAVDAGMVLSDETIEAGARPEVWGNHRPGMCYLEASHVDQGRWSMPARTFQLKGPQLHAVTAEWAPRMARLDAGSAQAAGPAYARREIVDFEEWLAETESKIPPAPAAEPAPFLVATTDDEEMRRAVALGDEIRIIALLAERGELNVGEDNARALAAALAVDRGQPLPTPLRHLHAVPTDPTNDTEENQMLNDQATALEELLRNAPRDPEIAQAVEGADPRAEHDDSGVPDIDLSGATTPGADMTPAERDAQFARIVAGLFAGTAAVHVDTTTEDMVDAWYSVPGMTPAQRPALTRRLRKLVDSGHGDDLGRGKWRLYRSATDAAATTGGDDGDDDD